MDARKIRDWLEVFVTLCVFAGLLLVVQEIRVNTSAVALQTAIDNSSALTEPFFQSEELHAASKKIKDIDGAFPPEAALIERYDLSPEEAVVWTRHLMQIWAQVAATYQFQDEEVALQLARTLLLAPDNRVFVENYAYFDPEFEQVLLGLLGELDDSGNSE